ncbi:hypothetical protein TRIATDRAFT_319874 [Trichoderma atroviride IMI 206040]|uniref:Zn(2)-C6 fungal-type domain-containing protein n=1 Tax=Hypocrea atroviridis (strain ATCC 20476 / IMI 206040) TaxID=452589 RepID=G9P137_HYPAI|nr:uncharacterized protein TRIATDRAFT_319874 [Trichoderma atroviride IMI 206040]EHK42445.1 hypothetical protein TRIATDRAFT_319874 [Trichoderma atroviride IMI 206040]
MSVMLVHDRGIRRRACGRCHRQKLACRRSNNSESCLRCVRANVACVSGPLRPPYRATPSYMAAQQPVEAPPWTQNNGASIALDPDDAQFREDADKQTSCWSTKLFHIHPELDTTVDFAPEQPLCEGFASVQGLTSPGLSTILGLHDDNIERQQEPDADISGSITPPKEGDLMAWIAKISQLNIGLHQNLHSIPPIGVWQECWTNPAGPNAARLNDEKDLAIDRTLQLSHQYVQVMNHVFSYFHSTDKIKENVSATLSPLGDPPQLLVLSCYSCLIETYDKILQHIEACAKIRLEMDASVAEAYTPIALPGLNIGTFEIAPSSTLKVVILLHIMEAMMAQVRRLVSEMTKPSDENGTMSGGLTAKTGNDNDPTSITRVSMQGIRAKEKAIVELINTVRDLAAQCKIL